MGLEPTRVCTHKILSLARLPIPTLPHVLRIDDLNIIAKRYFIVNNPFFYFLKKKLDL